MNASQDFTLHRKRPDATEDVLVATGTRDELLCRFCEVQPVLRPQYFMMHGASKLSHLEIENMARKAGLLD